MALKAKVRRVIGSSSRRVFIDSHRRGGYDQRVRFLVHGNSITPAVTAALVRHGHTVDAFPFVELTARELLEQLHIKQLDLLTDDGELVQSAIEDPPSRFDRCVVYLQLAGGDVEQDDAIDRLFARYRRLSPKKLYTVTETRVKVRQMPSPG